MVKIKVRECQKLNKVCKSCTGLIWGHLLAALGITSALSITRYRPFFSDHTIGARPAAMVTRATDGGADAFQGEQEEHMD